MSMNWKIGLGLAIGIGLADGLYSHWEDQKTVKRDQTSNKKWNKFLGRSSSTALKCGVYWVLLYNFSPIEVIAEEAVCPVIENLIDRTK